MPRRNIRIVVDLNIHAVSIVAQITHTMINILVTLKIKFIPVSISARTVSLSVLSN